MFFLEKDLVTEMKKMKHKLQDESEKVKLVRMSTTSTIGQLEERLEECLSKMSAQEKETCGKSQELVMIEMTSKSCENERAKVDQ